MTQRVPYAVEEIELEDGYALAVQTTMPISQLPAFFAGAYRELAEVAMHQGGDIAGPPFAMYRSVEPEAVDVEAVMPVSRKLEGAGRVRSVDLARGPAIQVRHVGPYEAMQPAYEAVTEYMVAHGLQTAGPPREVYLSDPAEVPDPSKWETLVVQPVVRK